VTVWSTGRWAFFNRHAFMVLVWFGTPSSTDTEVRHDLILPRRKRKESNSFVQVPTSSPSCSNQMATKVRIPGKKRLANWGSILQTSHIRWSPAAGRSLQVTCLTYKLSSINNFHSNQFQHPYRNLTDNGAATLRKLIRTKLVRGAYISPTMASRTMNGRKEPRARKS
jgi:hypothetical protein